MDRTQPEGVGTPSQPPTPSSSRQQTKRNETEAGLSGRQSPPKKQQLEKPTDLPLLDLSTLFLVGRTRAGNLAHMTLDAFSDPSIQGNGLRPIQYSYDKLRDWVEGTMGYSKDSPIQVTFYKPTGGIASTVVSDEIGFRNTLAFLWTRSFHPIPQNNVHTLEISEKLVTVPPTVQPAVQDEQPVQPEPVVAPEPEVQPPAQIEEPEQSEPQALPHTEHISVDDDDDQEPLKAEEFLRLVREATTAEDESLIPAEKDEPGARERLFNFDARTLKRALIFFDTNLNEEDKCKVKGMKGTLHIWQIYTAYIMFMNPILTGVNGLCIGLDVGFGKTRLALLYLRARARCLVAKKEFQAERKRHKDNGEVQAGSQDEKPRRHLRKGQTGCCPTQYECMVKCPCSWDSDTWRIFDYMEDLPALVIGPPGLKETWRSETEKAFVDYGDPKHFLNYYFLYGEPTSGNDLRDPDQAKVIVKDTQGLFIPADNSVDVGEGTACDIFFISNLMANKLLEKFQSKSGRSLAAFGAVIMDEMQNYKGTVTSQTMPFHALEKMSDASANPVSLYTLCGTTIEEGHGFLKAPAKHFRTQWRDFGPDGVKRLRVKSGVVPLVLREGQYEQFTKTHKQLVRANAKGYATVADNKEKAKMIRRYLKPFVKALRQNQVWRGMVLNPLPDVYDQDLKITPLEDKETKEARAKLLKSVQSLVDGELDTRKKAWLKRKNQALKNGEEFTENEPTDQDVIDEVVGNEKQENAWLHLSRASTFPYLAVLQQDKLVPEAMFKSDPCQAIPVRVQADLEANPSRRYVKDKEFSRWDFAQFAEKLQENSPKLKAFMNLINQVSHDTDPMTEPKDDPCKARHILAFVNNTISAVITYRRLITDKDLCQKIQPILFTSSIDPNRRQEIMKEMVQPGKKGDRTKVLIAVAKIAAEGHNLQRINNIVFLEMPNTLTKYRQAVGRAVRTGQEMKVNITRMYDNENLLESTNFKLLMGKKTVSELIYNVIRP